MTKTYKIEVDCAHCASKMETAAKKIDGVSDININFLTLKMKVTFADGADEGKVMQNIRTACRKIESDCEVYF